jgi:hypothetical protein
MISEWIPIFQINVPCLKLTLATVTHHSTRQQSTARSISVSPADPVVYAGAVGIIVAVALLSATIPAWRALRIDPMVALLGRRRPQG